MGEQKRKLRETWIAKALLLGYTIDHEGGDFYNLGLPSGYWLLEDGLPVAFVQPWRAAYHALVLSGVYDAKDAPRDTGVSRGKMRRLRSGRRKRGRAQGKP